MVQHITSNNSVFQATDDVDAFTGTGPDTLIVDNGASLIASGASADEGRKPLAFAGASRAFTAP